MRIEYRPIHLTEWVRKEIKQSSFSNGLNSEVIQNRLERLKGALSVMKEQPNIDFLKWLNELGSRDSVLLPFIFEEALTEFHKIEIERRMIEVAKLKRQLFFNSIEQCYVTGNFKPYWNVVRIAFESNYSGIIRNWSEERIGHWQEFIQVNSFHLSYISGVIQVTNQPLTDTLKDYFINDSHQVFGKIIIELFTDGSKNIYKDEKELFLEYLNKSHNLTNQLLVTGFVKSDNCYELEEISIKIFEKMGTYIKRPMLWSEVGEAVKKEFHAWYLRKNIREFFSGIDKNHERFIYWEKFIPKMEDALVIENERTILFYFPDVVIMEVLGTGAVYVYDLNYFENRFGQLITRYRESLETDLRRDYYSITFRLRRTMLMDREAVVQGGWLKHGGEWQFAFDNFLRHRLNWEVNRDAIVQESKTSFTI